MTRPWAVTPGGVTLAVRLTPRGGRDAVEGVAEAGGLPVMKVRVAAPPVDGAANTALCRFLARSLDIATGSVAITGGETTRVKRLTITGDGPGLAERLARLAGV